MSRLINRRQFMQGLAIQGLAASSLMLPTMPSLAQAALPQPPRGVSPDQLARDEAFWSRMGGFYDRTDAVVNLEHGYWGKMARPVQDFYLNATRMVNTENSYYARREYGRDFSNSVSRVADALGSAPEEIVLTRNASEAIQNLIRQYQGLQPGDAVLYADIDYPSFKSTMAWLEQGRGVRAIQLVLPPRATQAEIEALYRQAMIDNPQLKLMLITHVSNQHGLVVPVAAIAREARRRGVDVICDCAQSWGLLDFRIEDLEVDWAGFNLHKWIGSPVGVGALYMRQGSLAKIAPYPGERDPENTRAGARVHIATSNFAAMMSIPSALDFHQSLGGANKEARLRYLRGLWTRAAEAMQHIEVLGGADEESWTGMAAFRLRGESGLAANRELQLRLEEEFGIFTVTRQGLDSGACIRITPQVFTSADEVSHLVDALGRLA